MKLRKKGAARLEQINAVYLSLNELNGDSLVEFAEFLELCQNENYVFLTPGLAGKLQKLGLLNENGQLDPKVRDITLSAINGQGYDVLLVWPGIPE